MKKFPTKINGRVANVEVADDGTYRVFNAGDCVEITRNLSPADRRKIEDRLPKYRIAVKQAGRILGYFLADDEDLVPREKALEFRSMKEAQVNLGCCARTWDLAKGQEFEIVEA